MLAAVAVQTGMRRRFDPIAAGDLDAIFELRLADVDARYAIQVSGGQCQVARGAAPEAGARLTIATGDLLRLVSGVAQWMELLAARRLELTGDPFLALRFPQLFGLRA